MLSHNGFDLVEPSIAKTTVEITGILGAQPVLATGCRSDEAECHRTDHRGQVMVIVRRQQQLAASCDNAPVESPVISRVDRSRRWWSALRLTLVLLWLVAAVAAWWTTPREQSYEKARADAAAGRVTAFQWGDHWNSTDAGGWFEPPGLRQNYSQLGTFFAWKTSDGRSYWTDTTTFTQVEAPIDDDGYFRPGAAGIAQQLRAAGIEQRGGTLPQGASITAGITFLLAVVILGVGIAGPPPRRGTRWFWFWLIYLTPQGLGLLFWLLREHPWARSAPHAAPSGSVERRDRGALGFAIGLILAILYIAVVSILHKALGDWWVPRPGV